MAVTTTNRLAGPFTGNGTTTVFPFTFKVFAAADLYVGRNNVALALGTDYAVALNANQDVSPGGTVTLAAGPLETGDVLVLTSQIPELQQVVLTNLGGFFPDVINGALDRLTILIQQLQQAVNQSLKFALADDLSTVQLPPAAERVGKALYFGSDGQISLIAASPSGTALFSGPLLGAQDGVNRVFSLTNNGSAIGVTPVQATVWKNMPLIPGDTNGYVLGPIAGQVTYATAPSSDDSLFATGVMNQ